MGIFEMVRYPGDQTYRASARGGPAIHDTPSDQDIGSEPDKGAASLCCEVAFYEDARWISVGFNLLKENASYKRDYLLPRLRSDMYGGRVARLQSRYAAAAREDSHYSMLDERERAANLDWLQDRRKLGEEASKAIIDPGPHVEDGADIC